MSDSQFVADEALAAAIEANPEAVAELVRRLDLVNELLDVAELGVAALDDEMVTTLARRGAGLGELVDVAGEPETVRGLDALLSAIGAASDGSEPVGVVGLLGALRDPDVQRGLGFLVDVARETGRGLDSRRAGSR